MTLNISKKLLTFITLWLATTLGPMVWIMWLGLTMLVQNHIIELGNLTLKFDLVWHIFFRFLGADRVLNHGIGVYGIISRTKFDGYDDFDNVEHIGLICEKATRTPIWLALKSVTTTSLAILSKIQPCKLLGQTY
ncbi:hypothetical protein ACJX0J_033710 [Zea mays]